MKTLIIAEAGVNHNGDLKLARQLVETAAQAGADIVKFQTFNADRLVTKSASKAEYQSQSTDSNETQAAMLRRLQLSPYMHDELILHCKSSGIGFLSTGFDIESLDYLFNLGIEVFKIPSGEITNLPYLRHIAGFRLPVIMSTGMATMAEIEAALDVLLGNGIKRDQVTLLHCNTEYPTPMADVNLNAMCSIRETFKVAVGYSDHSQGIEVAIAAVAMGACVIEKHFTLDRELPGPDQQTSLEPGELTDMITSIRNIEIAMGNGVKVPSSSELKNIPIVRKSVVAARDIVKGEVFSEENLAVKRPGNGISPMQWDELIGRKAARDFAHDELIKL